MVDVPGNVIIAPTQKQGGKRVALLPMSQLAACPPPAPELPAYHAVAQPSSYSPFRAIASAGVPAIYSIPGGRPVYALNQVTKVLGKAQAIFRLSNPFCRISRHQ
jgi:hypothetical protein